MQSIFFSMLSVVGLWIASVGDVGGPLCPPVVSAQSSVVCDGCELEAIIYEDDYYAGGGSGAGVDGLDFFVTLGAGSSNGFCDGPVANGECVALSCFLGKITVWFDNDTTRTVYVSGYEGGPQVIILNGADPVGFTVGSPVPLEMFCKNTNILPVLRVHIKNWSPTEDWVVAVRCSGCPDPGF